LAQILLADFFPRCVIQSGKQGQFFETTLDGRIYGQGEKWTTSGKEKGSTTLRNSDQLSTPYGCSFVSASVNSVKYWEQTTYNASEKWTADLISVATVRVRTENKANQAMQR